MNNLNIKSIIFDLGGVIINLDMQRTIDAFERLGCKNFNQMYSQLSQSELFDKFDKGQIGEMDFFSKIISWFNLEAGVAELVKVWNEMLLDFPQHRLDKLKSLKKDYRTFLLSNTNETHIESFESILEKENGYKNLSEFFERDYYSCRMNMRKPELEIFNSVLNENALDPQETIFIDDTIIHVEAAKKCGIKAFLLPKGEEVFEFLEREVGIVI
ncbi:MAG: HAD family hydrolase [Bacteroidia bacterium]